MHDEIGEGRSADASWPRPGKLPDSREEIEGSGLFEDVIICQFDWEISYDAEQYK